MVFYIISAFFLVFQIPTLPLPLSLVSACRYDDGQPKTRINLGKI